MIRLGGAGTPYGWKTGAHDTAGIHFNHTGAPIVWYAFADTHTETFLQAVRSIVRPEVDQTDSPALLTEDCSDINEVRAQLRMGNWMLRPETLATIRSSLVATRVVQLPGDALYTLPGVFFSGFCTGWTILESIAVALPDWTCLKAATDRSVEASGLVPVFDTDFVVAQEMRCIQNPEVVSGAEAKNLIPSAFKTMVLRLESLLGDIKTTVPSATEKYRSALFIAEGYGAETCSFCHSGTSLAFVTNRAPHSKPYCLEHYKEAREGGVKGSIDIHLPHDWSSFNAWAGVTDQGGYPPFPPPPTQFPSREDTRLSPIFPPG